jgi:deoxyribodipyrimidine photolyase-related protein
MTGASARKTASPRAASARAAGSARAATPRGPSRSGPSPGGPAKRTVWILGDQLSRDTASLHGATPADTTVLFVVNTGYMASKRWHRQRLHVVLAGMAKLARQLRAEGFDVDEQIAPSFAAGLDAHRGAHAPSEVVAMSPMSWSGVERLTRLGVTLVPNDQFLCSADQFKSWAATKKNRLRMEDFYRWQRQRLDVLMEPDGEPCGGRWNYDDQNREPPPKDGRSWPQPEKFDLDEIDASVSALIDRYAPNAFGQPTSGLWPTTTAEATQRLNRVIDEVLPLFGPHEDAMLHNNWHLAHSLLSSAMNTGMLHPSVIAERAQQAYLEGRVPLASAEGFIRQVIGWREYVWGLYWLWMPEYAESNGLGATRPVPPALLGQPTKMRCVSRCVSDVDERGFAHHIQRLMVLGNLALVTGINPQAMTEWMWASFVDAAEWVMVPNVVGMSLHADGGAMATKPYAGGGAYISKMSDYCKGCHFDPKQRTGAKACPFTTLYWDFLARHEATFRSNHRMSQPMAGLRRLSDLGEVRKRAEEVLSALDNGTL